MYQNLTIREIAEGYLDSSSQIIITSLNKQALEVLFSNWAHLDIGIVLSERLLQIPQDQRKQSVVEIAREIINRTRSKQIILENIDILFSPEYSLNVLKFLSNIGKGMKFIILWHGKYEDGFITYSEPVFTDYHKYNLKDYDVFYITK